MAAELLKITLPMLLSFLFGFFVKRSRFRKTSEHLICIFNILVSRFFLPLVIFQAFLMVHFTVEYLACSIAFFLVMLFSFGVGFILRKLLPKSNPAFPFLMASYEGGLLGYPLSIILYPSSGPSYFALFDMGQMIFSYFVFIPIMQIVSSKKTDLGEIVKVVLLNPILDAMFLGLIAGKLGLGELLSASSFGSVFSSAISFISVFMTYGLLFKIGFDFMLTGESPVQSILPAVCRTATLLAFGLIASLILSRLIPYQRPFLTVMLLGCILPSPLCLTVVNDFKENTTYLNTVIPYSTLITFLLFPVLVSLSFHDDFSFQTGSRAGYAGRRTRRRHTFLAYFAAALAAVHSSVYSASISS